MVDNPLVNSLNEPQQQAALDFENPLLVLAGAGSGKTKMLTSKIAYGLNEGIFNPQSFLAVTFTNKAAGEMKHRISQMVDNINMRDSWVATFHSFGNRVLRQYAPHLGYTTDFTIFDTTDQTSLVKTVLKNLRFDNSAANARKISRQIQYFKSDLQAQQEPETY